MFAAMDTTSSALSCILWLLANHQDVQDKLRFEIRKAQKQKPDSADLLYDELVNLPLLEGVCRESLRLWAIKLRRGDRDLTSFVV